MSKCRKMSRKHKNHKKPVFKLVPLHDYDVVVAVAGTGGQPGTYFSVKDPPKDAKEWV